MKSWRRFGRSTRGVSCTSSTRLEKKGRLLGHEWDGSFFFPSKCNQSMHSFAVCESSVKQSAVVLSFAVIESLFIFLGIFTEEKILSSYEKASIIFYSSLADGMIKNVQQSVFFSSAPIRGTHDGGCAVVKRSDSGSNAAWLTAVTPWKPVTVISAG